MTASGKPVASTPPAEDRPPRTFVRVWEYDVCTHTSAFIAAYGADGDWDQLFRQSADHLGTELYRGVDVDTRFLTVDRWIDQAAWRRFLEHGGAPYQALDRAMEGLTAHQRLLVEGSS